MVRLVWPQTSLAAGSSADSLVSAERRRSSGKCRSPVSPTCVYSERAPQTGNQCSFRVCVFLCVCVLAGAGVPAALSVMLERIELENSGSLQGAQLQQEPEEVPEETLNRFNFSLEDEEAAG